MSEKYKNTCKYLNYVERFLILDSTVSGCFNFCICFISSGITNSTVGLKICPITAGIKQYKSIIKKKKKKLDKIVLLGKDKLNTIEVLISKALIDSYY